MTPFRSSVGKIARLTLLSLSLASCRRGDHETSSGKVYPRNQTLYVGGRQWGEPSSLNPLASAPDWPVISGVKLMYETLFFYDGINGQLMPLLAESYTQRDDEIEVVVQEKAHWNDGRPVTGWDVKYSFELGQRHKEIPVAQVGRYFSEIRLPEVKDGTPEGEGHPRKVVFVLNPEHKNPLMVLDALEEFRIVPRHVIEPLLQSVNHDMNRFLKFNFRNPAQAVCSGPYKIDSIQGEKIAVVRDDNYWGNDVLYGGKKPAPKYIVHPIYKSNDHFSVALQQGKLDVSSAYMPRIWLKQKKGVHTWFLQEPFYLASAIPSLAVNHKHKPLGDVHIRRAMGFAINYKDIRELAVSGYSPPLKPGLILPFGIEAKFFFPEDAQKYGTFFDPERAKAELRAGGYTSIWSPKGELIEMRDARGDKVPTVYIKSPTGWTDWESIVSIAARSMRAVGIDVRERFVDASLYWQSLYTGNWDLTMWTPQAQPTPSKPWSRFDYVMSTTDFVPEGQKMFRNIGRFNDPKSPNYVARIDELLLSIPNLKDEVQLVAAYRELNALFMQLQPQLPLVYRAEQLYQFSTRVWENWATAENPYAPPQVPGDRMGMKILWHLKPKSGN